MNMSNGKCHQCNADEDLCHLFFACHKSYTFLTEVFKMLHIIEPESILNDDYKLSLSNIIFGFSASLKFSELFNFVLLYSKWIIWTERNIKKYQNIDNSIRVMRHKLQTSVYYQIDIILRCKNVNEKKYNFWNTMKEKFDRLI